MSQQVDNIFAGTQVVSLVEVRGTNNSLPLRATHVFPLEKVVGREVRDETVEDWLPDSASSQLLQTGRSLRESKVRGIEGRGMDIVRHHVEKFSALLLKKGACGLAARCCPF